MHTGIAGSRAGGCMNCTTVPSGSVTENQRLPSAAVLSVAGTVTPCAARYVRIASALAVLNATCARRLIEGVPGGRGNTSTNWDGAK
jgi:hypothetical protein